LDFAETTNPNHKLLDFPTNCETCHTTDPGWKPASFDIHDDYYALNGAHAAIAHDCATCHNGDYANTPSTCDGCHMDNFNQTTAPSHAAQQFPTNCQNCHTEESWTPATFDHNEFYALTGGHAIIADECSSCHHGDYMNTPNTCAGCHTDTYNGTINPNHAVLDFPTNCEECHTTDPGWKPASFDIHNDYYALNGAHAAIAHDCVNCHNGDYNNTPNTCYGCHSSDYSNTVSPDHQALQFSTDCISCHSEDQWVPSVFDHDGQYFPIYSGAHEGEWSDCIDCHTNLSNYAEVTCTNCHLNPQTNNDHNGVPGYVYQDNACLACHPTGSADDNFDHNATNFPLTGAHVTVACSECHTSIFGGTPTNCDACHMDNFNGTTNPNHQALGLPGNCEECHTTEPGWKPAAFPNHDDYWELKGAHVDIANDCATCHNGDYNNTPNTCNGCHNDDYLNTTNPNHTTSQFPTDCQQCHTEDGWSPSSFNHNDYWELKGAHASIANNCDACHNGDYNNTPNTCNGCHNDDYLNTTNPNHALLQFPTDCQQCHTESAWVPSSFNHNAYWVLKGAHASIANNCNACHNGNFNSTPNTCNGCHMSDYNGTNNPNHSAAGFPTDCEECHTENGWTPSTFDHDNLYFPIYSGKHKNEWNTCSECHLNAGNFSTFSCIDCHKHDDPVKMANKHKDVSGYQYVSTACYSCHPDGDE